MSDAKRRTFCVYDGPPPEAIRKATDRITRVSALDPYFIGKETKVKATMTRLVAAAFVAASIALPASGAIAHGSANSTCAGLLGPDVHVHGDHVIRDYVKGPGGAVGHGEGAFLPGGPGPGFHFPNGVAPGASFCNAQSSSPGFHIP